MRRKVLGIVAVALGIVGCGLLESDYRAVVGVLRLEDGMPRLDVPTRAAAGEDFSISFATTSGDACAEAGSTSSDLVGMTATVVPYDLILRHEGGCLDVIQTFEHSATLNFAAPGTATVKVRGRSSLGDGRLVTFERQLIVE